MKRYMILIALCVAPSFGWAVGAHTEADVIDQSPQLERDSGIPYSIVQGPLEIFYSNGDPLESHAIVESRAVDETYQNVRVYYDAMTAGAYVTGKCDGELKPKVDWHWASLKIMHDGIEIEFPNPLSQNSVAKFPGGTVTFYATDVSDHSAEITGLILRFDSGETHTFAHAYADLGCTVPVELQSFSVD